MTEQRQALHPGQLLAALGALVLVGSLWLEWYAVRIPREFRDALQGFARGFGLGEPAWRVGAACSAAGFARVACADSINERRVGRLRFSRSA